MNYALVFVIIAQMFSGTNARTVIGNNGSIDGTCDERLQTSIVTGVLSTRRALRRCPKE